MGEMVLTLLDDDGEVSIARFPCPDLTAANIAATIAAGDALALAVQDITGCLVARKQFIAKTSVVSALEASTNPEGNREAKWLVRYYSQNSLLKHTLTIAGPLLADKDSANPKYADLADTEIAAFKTAFEAFVKPTADAVTLVNMEWVGRNL